MKRVTLKIEIGFDSKKQAESFKKSFEKIYCKIAERTIEIIDKEYDPAKDPETYMSKEELYR